MHSFLAVQEIVVHGIVGIAVEVKPGVPRAPFARAFIAPGIGLELVASIDRAVVLQVLADGVAACQKVDRQALHDLDRPGAVHVESARRVDDHDWRERSRFAAQGSRDGRRPAGRVHEHPDDLIHGVRANPELDIRAQPQGIHLQEQFTRVGSEIEEGVVREIGDRAVHVRRTRYVERAGGVAVDEGDTRRRGHDGERHRAGGGRIVGVAAIGRADSVVAQREARHMADRRRFAKSHLKRHVLAAGDRRRIRREIHQAGRLVGRVRAAGDRDEAVVSRQATEARIGRARHRERGGNRRNGVHRGRDKA